jgi:arabinofuranosyltransferase
MAALMGIALSVGGMLFAIEAARRRMRSGDDLFPLGAVVIAALPPFWQFSSSGLETGLTFFWIGLVSWCAGKAIEHQTEWSRKLFLLLGLAPVIRPDLAVLVFPVLCWALWYTWTAQPSVKRSLYLVSLFIAPGAVWQLFRMGYYGALIPNTYIAKEGLGSRWDQGLIYLWDLVHTYMLLPVLVVVILLALRGGDRRPAITHWMRQHGAVITLLLGGFLHAFMVCRSGGDFMHARLLLPALFTLACVGAVVRLPSRKPVRCGLVMAALGWACWVSLCARPSYGSIISEDGIADERQWYIKTSFTNRPVTLRDYEFHSFYRVGEAATIMARKQRIQALYWAHIGIAVGVIPDDITVVDPLALNDHIGSRIELVKRGRPGHEKIVPAAWFIARYPPPQGLVVTNQLNGEFRKRESPERIEAAQRVLASPELRELTEAVSAPLTAELFVKNIARAWRLTFMRIPADPERALARYAPEPNPS